MLANIKKVKFLNAKANLIYFCTSHCKVPGSFPRKYT